MQANEKFKQLYDGSDVQQRCELLATVNLCLSRVRADCEQRGWYRFVLDGYKDESITLLEDLFDGYCPDLLLFLVCSPATMAARLQSRARDDVAESKTRIQKFELTEELRAKRFKSLRSSGRHTAVLEVDCEPPLDQYYAAAGLADKLQRIVTSKQPRPTASVITAHADACPTDVCPTTADPSSAPGTDATAPPNPTAPGTAATAPPNPTTATAAVADTALLLADGPALSPAYLADVLVRVMAEPAFAKVCARARTNR